MTHNRQNVLNWVKLPVLDELDEAGKARVSDIEYILDNLGDMYDAEILDVVDGKLVVDTLGKMDINVTMHVVRVFDNLPNRARRDIAYNACNLRDWVRTHPNQAIRSRVGDPYKNTQKLAYYAIAAAWPELGETDVSEVLDIFDICGEDVNYWANWYIQNKPGYLDGITILPA